MSTAKFLVKLYPTNMGFINSSRLNFSPDFQNREEVSRGDLQLLQQWFKVRERYMQVY